ncbi:MAG TPA: hypothetical protein VK165_02005 [Azonexus sp.]|nr:hypothetical protein [Azonexus sp.]
MNNEQTAPDWSYWGNLPYVEIWQAVALSLNIDPANLGMPGGFDPSRCSTPPKGFIQRLDIACRNLPPPSMQERYTPPSHRTVWLDDFGAWATNLPYPWNLPDEFPRLESEQVCPDDKAQSDGQMRPNDTNSCSHIIYLAALHLEYPALTAKELRRICIDRAKAGSDGDADPEFPFSFSNNDIVLKGKTRQIEEKTFSNWISEARKLG